MNFFENNAYPTPLRNNPVLPLLLLSLAQQKNAPTTSKTFNQEYDYIIVGAGSSGSVVASRLSEIPCVSILLLEAGKSPPLLNDVPILARNFWFTDIDWAYKTVPQKHSGYGLVNNQVIWPSGKGLGGTSLLNGMLYVRGNKKNYDDWARQGAVGWSSSDVFPYFLKLEDNRDPEYYSNGYHTVDGPVSVQKPRYEAEMKKLLLESAELFGYKIVDSNGHTQTGYYDHQANQRNGQRCSTAKAYLVPAGDRKNLDILPNAFVRKVLIQNHRAVGVEFDHGGSTHTVKARKEVIMSAGTTNTAQLLMLSGIGPKEHLQSLNIKVEQDLPVGDNMQDHVAVPVPFQIDSRIKSILAKAQTPLSFLDYIHDRTGPLTSTEAISLVVFLNGPQRPGADIPDVQLYFAEIPPEYARNQFGMTPEVYAGAFEPYENSTMFLCLAQILHPKSLGTVRLNSTDPYDPPLIDPNYYDDPSDLKDAVEAVKACIKIGTSKPMQKLGAKRLLNVVPGCENLSGDDYIECIARSIIVTTNHQVGTAKMGNPNDTSTVVDPQLRVKNVEGLRVVDASIMPIVPYGNTNIPSIMVGEKGSDIIKMTIDCHTQIPFISQNDPTSPYYEKQGGFLSSAAGVLIFLIKAVGAPFNFLGSLADGFKNLLSSVVGNVVG